MLPENIISQYAQCFAHSPNFIFIKDLNLRVRYYNQSFCDLLGIDNKELLNKHDTEIFWEEYASDYFEHDKAALSGENYYQLEYTRSKEAKQLISLVNKHLIMAVDGSPCGIFCESRLFLKEQFFQVLDMSRYWTGNNLKIKIFESLLTTKLNNLTKRELDCLYFLLSGLPIKSIAYKLQISPRTVESHIDNIKLKWGCHTISDIFQRALENSYLYISPELFKENFR